MLYINKNQFIESGEIQTILEEDVIQVRRNATRVDNGEKETNLAPSQKVIKVVRNLLNVIVSTGNNELCVPKSQLTTLLKCDKKHTNDYIKNYFKGYGIGDYSFSNKYNITVNGASKKIKRETHYYLYFNKETLELMKSTMEIDGLDFDVLINQIPDCERKCNEIGAKTETQIDVLNYIDDNFIIQYKINIEKNLFTKEGHFSKETSIINAEDDSVIELGKKENEFIPKDKEANPIEKRLEELSTKKEIIEEKVVKEDKEQEIEFEQLPEEKIYIPEQEELLLIEERIEEENILQDECDGTHPEEVLETNTSTSNIEKVVKEKYPSYIKLEETKNNVNERFNKKSILTHKSPSDCKTYLEFLEEQISNYCNILRNKRGIPKTKEQKENENIEYNNIIALYVLEKSDNKSLSNEELTNEVETIKRQNCSDIEFSYLNNILYTEKNRLTLWLDQAVENFEKKLYEETRTLIDRKKILNHKINIENYGEATVSKFFELLLNNKKELTKEMVIDTLNNNLKFVVDELKYTTKNY